MHILSTAKRRGLGALGALLLVTGCDRMDWALMDEKVIAGAILETPAFSEPFSIGVVAHVAGSCEEVRLPAGWADLLDARAAIVMDSLVDGAPRCLLMPVSGSTRTGSEYAWSSADGGARWRIPVGSYGISGNNEDPILLTRSVTDGYNVTFSWSFYPAARLTRVVQAETTARETGLAGEARATFQRTSHGWRVSSMTRMPIRQR
jgi:hypothetical protein